MRPTKRTCLAIVLAALLVGVGLSGCQQPTSTTPISADNKGAPAPAKKSNVIEGTLSCSGRGCHASLDRAEDRQRWPSSCSYSLWLENDPHGNAYRVLSESDTGRRMTRLLGFDVTTEKRCLACHVTPQAVALPFEDGEPPQEWKSGVGCESCHGSARDWLVEHRKKDWKQKTPQEKAKYGMTDLSTLVGRARVCARCHVGAPAQDGLPLRDMNHDYIAAGHPRLMFEFAAFHANEPPHWKEKITGSDVAARAWLIGQFVAAEAEMALLADRARYAGTRDRPWPEFSEYDCYSCHHGLRRDSWRQERDRADTKNATRGQLRLSRWYSGLIEVVAPHVGGKKSDHLPTLKTTMRKSYPPSGSVQKQAGLAMSEVAGLAERVQSMKFTAKQWSALRGALAKYGAATCDSAKPGQRKDWDTAEQLALGLLALVKAEQNKALEPTVQELLKNLGFPSRFDSKPDFHQIERDMGKTNSAFDDELKKLFTALK